MLERPYQQDLNRGREERNSSVHFSLSTPSSASSSRSSSPAPSFDGYPAKHKRVSFQEENVGEGPGRKPMDVYDTTMSWWRAKIRRQLVKTVQWESGIIAKMQESIRTPWLDAYFVYTSSLGSHTFFMILLPMFFFFGFDEMGRGLIMMLAFGIYSTSVVKDLLCSPRPFAPPVTRLTIGSHHLEYGFPSTHSTNGISIALFFFQHVHQLASTPTSLSAASTSPTNSTIFSSSANSTIETIVDTISNVTTATPSDQPAISPPLFILLSSLLVIYSFTIVFGRLYTAMHSFTDCFMGVTLGTGIWWGISSWNGIPVVLSTRNPILWMTFPFQVGTPYGVGQRLVHFGQGLGGGEWIESWVRKSGWEVPVIMIAVFLLLVNQHPQPVDDCPCFEDAIAIGSVVIGTLLGLWGEYRFGKAGIVSGKGLIMPGSGWNYVLGEWVQVDRTLVDIFIWWGFATLKIVIGILTIFVWRIIAKSTLHLILPPLFRLLARAFRLPHRRFYTPATEYKNVPSEFNSPNGFGLHPIPSVIDLPGTSRVGVEVGGIGSGSGVDGGVQRNAAGAREREIKMRSVNGTTPHFPWDEKNELVGSGHTNSTVKGTSSSSSGSGDLKIRDDEGREVKHDQPTKHYDADVLTKVIVYAGIALIVTEVMPVVFVLLGWGLIASI